MNILWGSSQENDIFVSCCRWNVSIEMLFLIVLDLVVFAVDYAVSRTEIQLLTCLSDLSDLILNWWKRILCVWFNPVQVDGMLLFKSKKKEKKEKNH